MPGEGTPPFMNRTPQPHPLRRAGLAARVTSLSFVAACSDDDGDKNDIDNPVDGVDDQVDTVDSIQDDPADTSTTTG